MYDYVILDEVRSVVCCMTSIKTNGAHIRTNAMILQKLIKEAKLTIALDADLEVDGAVPFFFSNVVPGEIQVLRYKKTRIKRNLRISKDEVAFIQQVKDSLRAGQKVAIGCQNRRCYQKLNELPVVKILVVTTILYLSLKAVGWFKLWVSKVIWLGSVL